MHVQAEILKIVDGYSARALRVLAIAARPMSKMPWLGLAKSLEA